MVSSAYRAVLSPEGGLTSEWGISPPGDLPLWKVAVVLSGSGLENHERPGLSNVAGAAGFDRQSTIYRSVGEAVERASLFAESNADEKLKAASLIDLTTCEVDRREVDYPIEGSAAPYDSTPSGAAAGLSLDQATRAALVEQIERDALQVGWYRQDGLRRIEPSDLALLECHPTISAAASAYGVDLTVARLPVAHPGLVVIAALAVDRDSGLTSVGMKAAEDTAVAVMGAAAEALQIADALKIMAGNGLTDEPIAEKITNDEERARWLLEPSNAAMVQGWFRSAPADDQAASHTSEKITTEELVEAVARDGGVPVRVDLTQRLPELVRSVGWHAVKVLVRGYQPLRMDETLDSVLVPERIGKQKTTAPHPLI